MIILIWVLAALALIAGSVAKTVRVEVLASRNHTEAAQAYFAAKSGTYGAIYRILKERYQPPPASNQEVYEPTDVDRGEVRFQLETGTCRVEIQDESGKLNLNFAPDPMLRALLQNVGLDAQTADTIADSILDWRDQDNLHRLQGAEEDYYQSLPTPYHCKNGWFDSVEELLLVRGVTPETFYGRRVKDEEGTIKKYPGLADYLTVYSRIHLININYAEPPVLLSIPGLDPATVEALYRRRQERPFRTLVDIVQAIPTTVATNSLPFMTTQSSNVYTLRAVGESRNAGVKRVVRAVFTLDPRLRMQYRILYWNENLIL
ncbi:MAG: general secretion pathway protein GspK [Acidobacteria bacterium]|nr:general secretion pathway protein GspK [Acidobacteriota bacterium]